MQTRERKIFLMALESKEPSEISMAVKTVLSACIHDIEVDSIPIFDLEWAFLQIVINSIKQTMVLQVRIPGRESECDACGTPHLMKVDLTKATVPGVLTNKSDFHIEIEPGLHLKLRYPTEGDLVDFDQLSKSKSEVEKSLDLVSLAIESVSDADGVRHFAAYSYKDRLEFIEKLPPLITDRLEQFVNSIPRLTLDVKIQCPKCKFEVMRQLVGLADFFV